MAIITISRGSYSKGREVAEQVAQRLGYGCVGREVLLEASDHFNIPEIKLVRALHDAPSILERFTYGKERYIAYITAKFLEYVQKDNIVYHGLAGHFLIKGVPHVLKVRIIAELEDRVKLEMERENISRDKALAVLKKDDYERRRWSLALYGIDTADARLYDLVLRIQKLTVADAVETVCRTAQLPQFQRTPESQQALDDLLLAARAYAALVEEYPYSSVSAREGVIHVDTKARPSEEPAVVEEIKRRTRWIPGARETRVHVLPWTLY